MVPSGPTVAVAHHLCWVFKQCLCPGMRSRTSRLGLVSISDLCISDLVSVSTQNVSASRLGSRTILSCQDVSRRRTQLNYNSPMKTSRPMPYSVGRSWSPLRQCIKCSKSLKTVIPDKLSKRDPLSLLWRIIWSLNDKRSHSVRSAWQAEMVAGGGDIHAVDDCTSRYIFKVFFAVSTSNRFHPVRKLGLQQQNIDRGWRLTTISQCRKAHNVIQIQRAF